MKIDHKSGADLISGLLASTRISVLDHQKKRPYMQKDLISVDLTSGLECTMIQLLSDSATFASLETVLWIQTQKQYVSQHKRYQLINILVYASSILQ